MRNPRLANHMPIAIVNMILSLFQIAILAAPMSDSLQGGDGNQWNITMDARSKHDQQRGAGDGKVSKDLNIDR
jgi:hypothetical protein